MKKRLSIALVVLALLALIHLIVHHVDGFSLIRSLHGG